MDDPGWSWPAWKFGLKRSDLFTSLHDQYNTFTFSIQDPAAFHADVNEICHDASTPEEFHRLMADRRKQRLQELHDSLESSAIEIIANPELMDSDHWEYAVQLFRTKSFDSLVSYFASYLPDGYLDDEHTRREAPFPETQHSDILSVDETRTKTSSVHGTRCEPDTQDFAANDDSITVNGVHEPLSPPASETHDESHDEPRDDMSSRDFPSDPPSPSMSFSGSELGAFCPGFSRSLIHDDDASSQSDCETAITSVSDSAESRSSLDSVNDKDPFFFPEMNEDEMDDDYDDLLTAQLPEDCFDILDEFDNDIGGDLYDQTPTPRSEAIATSYVEYKSASPRRFPIIPRRSPSPNRHRTSPSPLRETRRSPVEVHSKVQKPSIDPIRKRPKGRI